MTRILGTRFFQTIRALDERQEGYSMLRCVETEVTIEVDLDFIARVLGQKALFNKSRRTKALHGGVIVTVKKV